MKTLYKKHFLNKQVLVAEGPADQENLAEILTSFSAIHNTRVIAGAELLNKEALEFYTNHNCIKVPNSFYSDFPASVKNLTREQRALDQILHYFKSWVGIEDERKRSIFEQENAKEYEEATYKTSIYVPNNLRVISEQQAEKELVEVFANILSATRPLNNTMKELAIEMVKDGYPVQNISSKNTAIILYMETANPEILKFLTLSDFVKAVQYTQPNIKKCAMSVEQKALYTTMLDQLLSTECDYTDCYKKQANWCGILHHLHYKGKNPFAVKFINSMRSGINRSLESQIDCALAHENIIGAVSMAVDKSPAYFLRNIEYLLSRCITYNDRQYVFDNIKHCSNNIVLLQLMYKYCAHQDGPRTFAFLSPNKNVQTRHIETPNEVAHRKTNLPSALTQEAFRNISNIYLENIKKLNLGKVYINEGMQNISLPLSESTSNSGKNTLPTGSRMPVNGNNVRCFTYWKKVDDIDLACFVINKDNTTEEISWRTMFGYNNDNAIVHSGDITDGYNGGTEYFDVDIKRFKKLTPDARYIIFTDTVFSYDKTFDTAEVTAGFMLRDNLDVGKPFDVRTVATRFAITGDASKAILFALDLESEDIIWLNKTISAGGCGSIASTNDVLWCLKYAQAVNVMNLYKWFSTAGTQVENMKDADIIISDDPDEYIPNKTIRSCDADVLLKYINM